MKNNRRKIPLFVWILTGLLLGVACGLVLVHFGLHHFSPDYIKPWGTIFIKLLKLIAIPLILFSLIKGVSDLKDVSRLTGMGLKTIGIYLLTTMFAICLGLVLVNLIQPGKSFSSSSAIALQQQYADNVAEKKHLADKTADSGPLQFVVDIVPENFGAAVSDNSMMLQVIFLALLIGIAMVLLPDEKTKSLKNVIDSMNDVILKIIDIIMKTAPVGVFALMASVITDLAGNSVSESAGLFSSLLMYFMVVLIGLFLLLMLYPFLARVFTGIGYLRFVKGVFPAQLLAFSTSSSAATLPATKKCVEENLGVDDEVSSFVLPLGATLNMDGTALYQAVAAVFIAQVYGIELTLMAQLSIVLTATLASIGAAAVPGAGIIILAIILNSIHVPVEGIALIFAVDRPLDMIRTTVNITGDSFIAKLMAKYYGNRNKA